MGNTFKVLIWLAVFSIGSIAFLVFAKQSTPQSLVESSIAQHKVGSQIDSVGKLYKDMGFNYPTRINPCIDLENETRRYCTPNALRFLLDKPDRVFSAAEDKIYRSFLNSVDPCEQVSLYIGRVCKQEKFWKILTHFRMEKER